MERRTEVSPAEGNPAGAAGRAGGLPDGEALAAVCEAVESLLAQASPPVARLRVRCGQVSVDLRWPAIPVTDRWSTPAPVSPAPSTGALADSAKVLGETALGETVLGEAASVLGEAAADPAVAELAYIKSPMVGTFYHASSPDTAPFVQVGDFVEAGQQVGVLEAMKLMNAVEAERPGRVVEILVADATGVEFDQALIAIAPLDSDRGE